MGKRLVALTGAGISAESGLRTFRDAGGLWEGYRVEDVATPEAWAANPEMVLQFYNERRKQALTAEPNAAHHLLKKLEDFFEVHIITQNVDPLHERAGSTTIVHLHGELFKARSTHNPSIVLEMTDWQLNLGDHCPLGSQLRPHIVWFGEEVPLIPLAARIISEADVVLIIGTSMVVYPAAGLIDYAPYGIPVYVIDPQPPPISKKYQVKGIQAKASAGMQQIFDELVLLAKA